MKVYINFPDILVSYTCAYTNTHTKERKKSEKQYLPERLMMASGRAYRAAQKMARWTSLARPNIPESNCQILLVVHFFFFFSPVRKQFELGHAKNTGSATVKDQMQTRMLKVKAKETDLLLVFILLNVGFKETAFKIQ